MTTITKIISGGQTGADRGGLDAAIAAGTEHGGWCPRGRRAEDGRIPDQYQLKETESSSYPTRTRLNVRDSDGTLIIGRGPLTGGSALTMRVANQLQKPVIYVNLEKRGDSAAVLRTWIQVQGITILNVAGSRESRCPGIQQETAALLGTVIGDG